MWTWDSCTVSGTGDKVSYFTEVLGVSLTQTVSQLALWHWIMPVTSVDALCPHIQIDSFKRSQAQWLWCECIAGTSMTVNGLSASASEPVVGLCGMGRIDREGSLINHRGILMWTGHASWWRCLLLLVSHISPRYIYVIHHWLQCYIYVCLGWHWLQ